MSQIKNEETARLGLSGLFGTATPQPQPQPKGDQKLTKEELVETLSVDTRAELEKEVQRRHYLKVGRPPMGAGKKSASSVPMTFRITPEKQAQLREVALLEGKFIGEIMSDAIDLYIAKFEEGRK